MFHYAYTHTSTEATTGYFSCVPEPSLSLEESFERLAQSPLDDFLHRHALRTLVTMTFSDLRDVLQAPRSEATQPIVATLLWECALLNPALAALREMLPADIHLWATRYTPLPYVAWPALPNKEAHRLWSAIFSANIEQHTNLPHPEELEEDENTPVLYTHEELQHVGRSMCHMTELHARHQAQNAPTYTAPPPHEVATQALTLLVEHAIVDGVEMRHEASLSPIALLRPWRLRMRVHSGRHHFSVEGQATTYGRGLSLAQTRASYSMEMIERASSYASVTTQGDITYVQGMLHKGTLLCATYAQCLEKGLRALDPNTLPLEIPYAGDAIYWMAAEEAHSQERVLVPFQCVFLFSNLDEKTLFLSAGSTGLAAGTTIAEAKLAALTEVIERDAEAVMPYDRKRCFTLRARDELIQSLLDDYAARGVHIHFLDLTTEFGLPCYQAFVISRTGDIVRATGAHLSGARAVMAALTEVPWPYPHSPASGAAIKGLPERFLEDLPNYTLPSPESNVALIEDMLIQHGHTPLYVNITQKDLAFPVVRALVPGLELSSELGSFSRICPRLYANYQRIFDENL